MPPRPQPQPKTKPSTNTDLQASADKDVKELRVQVNFDASAQRMLKELQTANPWAATGATVIRDALGFYSWVRRQIRVGYRIGLVKDGSVREVVLPFEMK